MEEINIIHKQEYITDLNDVILCSQMDINAPCNLSLRDPRGALSIRLRKQNADALISTCIDIEIPETKNISDIKESLLQNETLFMPNLSRRQLYTVIQRWFNIARYSLNIMVGTKTLPKFDLLQISGQHNINYFVFNRNGIRNKHWILYLKGSVFNQLCLYWENDKSLFIECIFETLIREIIPNYLNNHTPNLLNRNFSNKIKFVLENNYKEEKDKIIEEIESIEMSDDEAKALYKLIIEQRLQQMW